METVIRYIFFNKINIYTNNNISLKFKKTFVNTLTLICSYYLDCAIVSLWNVSLIKKAVMPFQVGCLISLLQLYYFKSHKDIIWIICPKITFKMVP